MSKSENTGNYSGNIENSANAGHGNNRNNVINNYYGTGKGLDQSKANNIPRVNVGKYEPLLDFYQKVDETIKNNTGKKIAVVGFSGLGKTAGICHWATKTDLNFDLMCFIDVRKGNVFGDIVDLFENNISAFYPNLNDQITIENHLKNTLNSKDKFQFIKNKLGSGKKLLILDDLMEKEDEDVMELLKSLENDANFYIILTSRRPEQDFSFQEYDKIIFQPSRSLCLKILTDYQKDTEEQKQAEELCDYLADNTLAISQIANLIEMQREKGETLQTLSEILVDLKKEKGWKSSKIDEVENLFHKEGVYQTLELVWKKLNEKQQFLARLCGQMALAPIPQYWFDEINKANNKKDFEKSKIALFRWLVLNKNETENTFKLHELWYRFLRYDKFEELTEINKQNLEYSSTRSVIESIKINQPDLMTKDEIKTQSLIVPHLEKLRKSNQELGIIFAIEQCLKIYYLAIGDFENAFNCINSIIEKFDISSVEYFKLVIDKMEIYIQKYSHLKEKLNPNLLLEAEKFILEVKIEKLDKLYQSLYFGKYAHITVDLARIYRKDNTLENIYKSEVYYNLTQENAEKSINLKEQILELRDCDFNIIYTSLNLTKHYLVQQIRVIYDYLSLLYMYFEEFEKSLNYRKLATIQFEKAIEIQQNEQNNLENHDYKKTLQTGYYNYGLLYDFANDNEKGQEWLQTQPNNWQLIAFEYAQKSLTLAEIIFEKEDDRYKLSKNLVQKLKITREYNKLKECNIIIVGGEHAQGLADYWNNNIGDIIKRNLDKI